MDIGAFKHDFKRLNGVFATPQVVLFRRPLELYDLSTGEILASFNSVDEALAYELEGVTLRERVAGWTGITFPAEFGGRGGGSGGYSGGFPSGGGDNGEDLTEDDFPARINVKVSVQRNYQDMVDAFIKAHGSSFLEHGVVVDEYGFATKYKHGNIGSISGLTGSGKEIAIHNHPAHGWPVFSKEDVVNTALGTRKGVVAVSTKAGRDEKTAQYAGTYTFVKGTHFNASGFVKAINEAQLKGKDVNSAAHSWLKRNQKKYGYKYSFVPAK